MPILSGTGQTGERSPSGASKRPASVRLSDARKAGLAWQIQESRSLARSKRGDVR